MVQENWAVENGYGDCGGSGMTLRQAMRSAQEDADRTGEVRYVVSYHDDSEPIAVYPTEDEPTDDEIVEDGRADTAEIIQCECGTATDEACGWSGSAADAVRILWMPEHLRDSHAAAGNTGAWPHNGSLRLRVAAECADYLAELDSEWTTVL